MKHIKCESFYFNKTEVITTFSCPGKGIAAWSLSALVTFFSVTVSDSPTQLVPEHTLVLRGWQVNALKGLGVTRWNPLCFKEEKGQDGRIRVSPSQRLQFHRFSSPTFLVCEPCYNATQAGVPDRKGFALLWCLGFIRGNPLSRRYEAGFLPSQCYGGSSKSIWLSMKSELDWDTRSTEKHSSPQERDDWKTATPALFPDGGRSGRVIGEWWWEELRSTETPGQLSLQICTQTAKLPVRNLH